MYLGTLHYLTLHVLFISNLSTIFVHCYPEPDVKRAYSTGLHIANGSGAFSWSSCGGDMAEITDLSVIPDPLQLPGTLRIQANGIIRAATIDSPLLATLEMKKKVAGDWIKIPCVRHFGSCSYDDLCYNLESIVSCPDPIVSSGFHCQCPFIQGSYNVPSVDINIPYSYEAGVYNITGTLHYKKKLAACLNIMITIQ